MMGRMCEVTERACVRLCMDNYCSLQDERARKEAKYRDGTHDEEKLDQLVSKALKDWNNGSFDSLKEQIKHAARAYAIHTLRKHARDGRP
jgi:hypothetical protein